MSLLLFLVAQTVPVPSGAIRPFDHDFGCTIFTVEGGRQLITGSAKAKGKWNAQLVLGSKEAGPLPVGSFRATVNGPANLSVKVPASGGEEYTYIFERTSAMDTRPDNGTVIVSKQKWPGAFSYVATGVCNFSSKVAQ